MADPEEKRGLASDKVGLSTKAHLTADGRIEKSQFCTPDHIGGPAPTRDLALHSHRGGHGQRPDR